MPMGLVPTLLETFMPQYSLLSCWHMLPHHGFSADVKGAIAINQILCVRASLWDSGPVISLFKH